MSTRRLGNTGISVSEIGLGCEGFHVQQGALIRPLLDVAEQAGVNYIDLYIPDPELRSGVGEALKGRRDKFVLQGHLCSVWKDGQYKSSRDLAEVKAGFEDLQKRLGTDMIDVGMIHYVDSMSAWDEVANGAVADYARELRAAGKIRHIGMSSHNPQAALAAVNSGLIEVLMFSVNPCYDMQPASENVEELWADEHYEKNLLNMDPDRQALYEACARLGVGITVMKAFGGGDLLSESLSPAGKALTLYQCIGYALGRPAVATVISGARTVEELQRSAAYLTAPEAEKDYAAALAAFPKISWQGHCMYCSHCAPCPREISVADVTKFLSLALAQGELPETVREHYAALPHKAGECIECGACEKRCPFDVKIIENMRRAQAIFGN